MEKHDEGAAASSSWAPPQRKVLLYSGGMDSEIVRVLMQPDVNLFIDNGSRYSAQELQRARDRNVPNLEAIPLHGLTELPSSIVPGRNAVFAILASNFGNHILLAATKGDRNKDKDHMFGHLMSSLLTYMWLPQSWTAGYPQVRVELPVKDLYKRQLLDLYIREGHDPFELWERSYSCYAPLAGGGECGICKACWRKWVAFRAAGVEIPPPVGVIHYLMTTILPLIQSGESGRGDEDMDVLQALRLEGVLPD